MANPEHLAKLREGVEAWNEWHQQNAQADAEPFLVDLTGADLTGANLTGAEFSWAILAGANLAKANLSGADLSQAYLSGTKLRGADLSMADLSGATLGGADLHRTRLDQARLTRAHLDLADLSETILIGADLSRTSLGQANLSGADLSGADLTQADLSGANLSGAILSGAILTEAMLPAAILSWADLSRADLRWANLSNAILEGAALVGTNLENANLTGCKVYGISAWDVRLDGAIQSNLVITGQDQSVIQVDNLEVAQFVYLLLNNQRIRQVIDTITSRVVLILGRFTDERKAVLDAIREELRRRDYLPILFDFQKPDSKDLTGTVTTLANLARFIIADLTDPSSVPHELAMVIPGTVVPVQTIILEGQREYAMFRDLQARYHWVLEPYRYQSEASLLDHLAARVIGPAEARAQQLRLR